MSRLVYNVARNRTRARRLQRLRTELPDETRAHHRAVPAGGRGRSPHAHDRTEARARSGDTRSSSTTAPASAAISASRSPPRRRPTATPAVMAPVTTNAIGMATYTKLGYNLERDLAPVALAGNVPHVLVAHPTLPVKNVKELDRARESAPRRDRVRLAGPGHALAPRAGDAEADGRLHRAARAL